jgi:hypothetical protein
MVHSVILAVVSLNPGCGVKESQLPPLATTVSLAASALGSQIDDVMAKSRNTTPPTSVTVFTEIF